MEAKKSRILKTGAEFTRLMPPSTGRTVTRKSVAGTADTINLVKRVVAQTLSQTASIAPLLKGQTLKETCRNIWQWVYQHIQYAPDAAGFEQIREPARIWADRTTGVDCDDYTVIVSSILTNLKISHVLRVTAYKRDWQHIYPIVPKDGNARKPLDQSRDRNSYIVIDCVPDHYDYEVPYSKKLDTPIMVLQQLSGLDGLPDYGPAYGHPGHDDNYGMGDLAGRVARQQRRATKQASTVVGQNTVRVRKTRVGKLLQKGSKAAMKVNPATVAVRNAWLLAMKINAFGIARKLRLGYATPAVAARFGYSAQNHARLVARLKEVQNTFQRAGGDAANLKKSIINGAGNKDRAVSGLGELGIAAEATLAIITPILTALAAALNAIKPAGRAAPETAPVYAEPQYAEESVSEEPVYADETATEGVGYALYGPKNKNVTTGAKGKKKPVIAAHKKPALLKKVIANVAAKKGQSPIAVQSQLPMPGFMPVISLPSAPAINTGINPGSAPKRKKGVFTKIADSVRANPDKRAARQARRATKEEVKRNATAIKQQVNTDPEVAAQLKIRNAALVAAAAAAIKAGSSLIKPQNRNQSIPQVVDAGTDFYDAVISPDLKPTTVPQSQVPMSNGQSVPYAPADDFDSYEDVPTAPARQTRTPAFPATRTRPSAQANINAGELETMPTATANDPTITPANTGSNNDDSKTGLIVGGVALAGLGVLMLMSNGKPAPAKPKRAGLSGTSRSNQPRHTNPRKTPKRAGNGQFGSRKRAGLGDLDIAEPI